MRARQKTEEFKEIYNQRPPPVERKIAEDSESFILRLYETVGQRTQAEIIFSEAFSEVWETDMMERKTSKLSIQGKSLPVELGACEIKTIQIHK